MKSSSTVNFETFYFFKLLETIRENGAQKYNREDQRYLDRFVDYLNREETAQENIEKLALSQTTGDLALFFSDIVDQLSNTTPEAALDSIPARAGEFLEIFDVFLQSEEWKASVDAETAAEALETPEEQLSFREYCRNVIQTEMEAGAKKLPAKLRQPFRDYLTRLLAEPDMSDRLEKQIDDPRVTEFAILHREVTQDVGGADLDEYIENFEKNAREWATLFRSIVKNHNAELEAFFRPAPAEAAAPAEVEERPFEELFEEAEKEAVFETPEAQPEPVAEELEMLSEEIEQKKARRAPALSEEDRARRKFLRDYVVSEVRAYVDEIMAAVDQLIETPYQPGLAAQLNEGLKGLKDLGQIHAYPGVEEPARELLQVFNHLQEEGLPFTESERPLLESLLESLPAYIDAAIAQKETPALKKIRGQVRELRSQLFAAEALSEAKSAETLESAFQEVAQRSAGAILAEMESGITEKSPQTLAPVFENLGYWSGLLLSGDARETVECVRELLQPQRYHQLSREEQQLLADVVQSWKSSFADASAEVWENYHRQLAQMLPRPEAEKADEALQAYKEVTARQLTRFIDALQKTAPDPEELIAELLPEFLLGLQSNSALIRNDDLEIFFRMAEIKLKNSDPAQVQDPESFREGLIAFFETLKARVQRLPKAIPANALLKQFDELLPIAEAVREEPARPPQAEAVAEVAPAIEVEEAAAVSSDEEIMEVFKLEAQNYISELREGLLKLRRNPRDERRWRDLGINTHTLKGSAQMVGRQDIAELAEPLDHVVDLIGNESLAPDGELFDIFSGFVDALEARIYGQAVETEALRNRLNAYLAIAEVEREAETAVEMPGPEEAPLEAEITAPEPETPVEAEIAAPEPEIPAEAEIFAEIEAPETEKAPAQERVSREDMVYLEERDPELLEIFQNEVDNNFDIIEKNLANLEKFSYDKEALQQAERAVHELRSASKMLGIIEVSTLTDKLENIFELLIQQKVENFRQVIPVTRRAMLVIRELTAQRAVRRSLYDEVVENLARLIEAPEEAELAIEEPVEEAFEEAFPGEPLISDMPLLTEERAEISAQVMELYLQEAREQLDDINYLLLKLEKAPENEELQHHLMRCMHTLKGSSGMVYAQKIETLAHRCEDILDRNLKAKNPLPAELFDLLFEAVDEISHILESLQKQGREEPRKFDAVLLKLENYFRGVEAAPAEAPKIKEARPVAREVPAEEEGGEMVTLGKREEAPAPGKETFLRLNIKKMDHLLNLVAELVISNNQFKNQLDRLKNFIPMLNSNLKAFRDTEDFLHTLVREGKSLQEVLNPLVENKPGAKESLKKQVDSIQRVLKNVKNMQDELTSLTHTLKDNSKTYDENLQKLTKLGNELLDEIMQARLVPINLLFQRFHRPIRDLARQLQKQIRLSISGEDTELDRALVDELYEPLLHLIRNAIDHGLETAKERKAAGKDPEGLLEIKASRERNQVIIEIRDDGRGIDLEKVKKYAIKKDLVSKSEAEKMTDQELFEYLFYPGFSTAREATLVSGRGVGLDAVKVQIEKAKGDIRTYTEKGKGTTFSIRVPISLSVVQSMLVEVGGHVYSVPLMQVEETLHVSGRDMLAENDRYYIRYREKKFPVVQLAQLLKVRDVQEKIISVDTNYPVIMVQDEGNRVALVVDKIIRREEILIKSLGPGLRRLKYISGGSIMADGQVVLVLDIPQIIQDILKGARISAPRPETAVVEAPVTERKPLEAVPVKRKRKVIQGRKPIALVVDDSLSIRKYLSSLLMQKGYAAETARNGYEALELLNKQEFDIMVTDLEMPKLSGYELIETLRYDQRFTGFPIIVLTGRAGENFRQLTAELGADAYIIKPFKDRELFEQLDKFIEYKG